MINPFGYFGRRAAQRSAELVGRVAPGSDVQLCMEGLGDWGTRVYRPALAAARAGGLLQSTLYRDIRRCELDPPLMDWETFELKRSPHEPPQATHDALIVATPDVTHIEVLEAAAGAFNTAIIEKPFCIASKDVVRARLVPGLVLGVDHFPAYIGAAADYADEIWRHLGGQVESVRFVLLQRSPIETQRLPSLRLGLTYDMLPHFLAILVSLGFVGPVAATTVCCAGRHSPFDEGLRAAAYNNYDAETWSETQIDLAETPSRPLVRCSGLVGKGFPVDVRFIELVGPSGTAVRLDLGSQSWRDRNYPFAKVALLAAPRHGNSAPAVLWLDPRRIVRIGPSLSRARPYPAIANQLSGGTGANASSASLFTLDECEWMVSVLESLAPAARHMAQGDDRVNHELDTFPSTQVYRMGWE